MSLLDRLSTAWHALTAKGGPPMGGYMAGYGGGPWFSDAFRFRRAPSPIELVESYKSLIYACVNINANAVARTPLRLYAVTRGGQARPKYCGLRAVSRKTVGRLGTLAYTAKAMAGAESVEEVTDHPLLDAVMKVNEDLDHQQLLVYTVMSLEIVGSAYWWPDVRVGLPRELWALPPHLVWPMFTSGSMVPDSYQFGGVTYARSDLIRFRHLSAKNPYGQGYSPTQAAIEYARLEDTFVSVQENMLANGPRPSLIISHKDPKGVFGSAERERIKFEANRKARGGRAGEPLVIDGAAEAKPLSYDKVDTGVKEISTYDLERIANVFDVPISMLRTEDVNRANAEAGQEQHARNGVEPRCKLIASTLTRWTHSQDPRGVRGWDRLFWAFDSPVQSDRQLEAELHKTYVSMGLPINTALTEAGYEPVEGGDVSYIPGTLVPLGSTVPGTKPLPGQRPAEPLNDGNELDEEEEETEAGATTEPAEDDTEDDAKPRKALSEAAVLARVATLIPRLEAQLSRDERSRPQ